MDTQTNQHACNIVVTTTNVDGTTETATMDPTSAVYPLYALQLAALLEQIPGVQVTCSAGTEPHPALGAYSGPLNRALVTCLLTFAAEERAPGCTDNVPGMEHYELDGEHMVTSWEALKQTDPATLTRAVFDALPPEQKQRLRPPVRKALLAGLTEHAEALKGETRPFPPELDNVRRMAETVLGSPETANLFYEAAHPEATKDGGKVH
jgi:hypothetical protein